ncbi:phenylacetate--CoA ligase family protein, partial [Desulfovibrio sp.]
PAGLGLVLLPRQMECLWRAFPQTPPGLCAALCAADWLDPGLRRQVEQGWDCLVLDHYGSTESAFAGAVQCRCREGRHVRALDLLLEIVHPVTGKVLPAGETGELVITTLQRRAMPLLRYRTGDMASLLDGPCACGSPLPRLGPVLGRIEYAGQGFRVTHPRKGGSEERRSCTITL